MGMLSGLAMTTGCTSLLTGANGQSAGRPIGADNRTQSEATDDARISAIVRNRLGADPELAGARLQVVTRQRVVTLQGTVAAYALRDRAVRLATDVAGVARVQNRVTVRLP